MPETLISIVIPTYEEVENIPLIAAEIDAALVGVQYEIIFVDDNSNDGSIEAVDLLQNRSIPAKIVVRKHERGLSTAVIRGLREAIGQYLVVMDCDLSHPATAVLPMVEKLQTDKTDFIIGSRYVKGGSFEEDWGVLRLINSKVATWLALPLCRVHDPMSGFFAFACEKLETLDELTPTGYKIGLEIMVKGSFSKPSEYPIHFKDREFGESKLGLREQVKYLRHLRRLYKYKFPVSSEFFQFGFVGGTGFLVDSLIYFFLQFAFGLNHNIARAISFWPASTWNWFWNRTVTFTDRDKSKKLLQWLSFLSTSLLGFASNVGTYYLLTNYVEYFKETPFFALIIGVFVGMGFNFMMARVFVFRALDEEIKREAKNIAPTLISNDHLN